MNYLLALETSGKAGSVALIDRRDPTAIVGSVTLPNDQGSAQSLVPSIQRLLDQAGVSTSNVGCIALLSGPGSFTGLRVGVATAKTLGYALKIPLVELDTLDVIFHQWREMCIEPNVYVHSMLDAYRGQLFVRSFRSDADGICDGAVSHSNQANSSFDLTRVVDIDQFLTELMGTELPAAQHVFVGPGCERVERFLKKEGADGEWIPWAAQVRWETGEEFYPQASMVAKLGVAKWREEIFVDPFQLLPHYYRGSAAEEKVKARNS